MLARLYVVTQRPRRVARKAGISSIPTPTLIRKQTPLDGVPAEVFSGFAAFVRRVAPRWVNGSRSLNRLTLRHAHQRELARSRRRGYRLVSAPRSPVASARATRQRRR